jgi:hypothetical protein
VLVQATCGNASQGAGGPVNIVVVRGSSLLQKRKKSRKRLTLLWRTNCVRVQALRERRKTWAEKKAHFVELAGIFCLQNSVRVITMAVLSDLQLLVYEY